MTRAQVSAALSANGNSFDTWVSLEDSFKYFVMESDKNNFVSASAVEFYFSGTNDYFLTRHIGGKPVLTELADPVPTGYTKVFHDGKYYLLKIEPGGIVDPVAGVFHDLTAYSSISGFFKTK